MEKMPVNKLVQGVANLMDTQSDEEESDEEESDEDESTYKIVREGILDYISDDGE